jgi:23S rRNA pseudouridine1911/1915/1917 synthase
VTDGIDCLVSPTESGKRLDTFIAAQFPDVSRSRIQALVAAGEIMLNNRVVRPSHRVSTGDRVVGRISVGPGMSAAPESIPLTVVYRDRDLAVIDKPAGMVVHPAPGHERGTLANAVASLFPQTAEVGGEERPGIVHRLDKDTSGLMVVALNSRAHRSLQAQIAERTAGREYIALVSGHVRPREGVIDAPIGRDPHDRKRMSVYGIAARSARTMYRVDENIGDFDLVHARLQSGRTHQIRVHFAALGHSVAGDETYGGARIPELTRQFLHAQRLSLRSPSTDEVLTFTSELPPELERVLESLKRRVGWSLFGE